MKKCVKVKISEDLDIYCSGHAAIVMLRMIDKCLFSSGHNSIPYVCVCKEIRNRKLKLRMEMVKPANIYNYRKLLLIVTTSKITILKNHFCIKTTW